MKLPWRRRTLFCVINRRHRVGHIYALPPSSLRTGSGTQLFFMVSTAAAAYKDCRRPCHHHDRELEREAGNKSLVYNCNADPFPPSIVFYRVSKSDFGQRYIRTQLIAPFRIKILLSALFAPFNWTSFLRSFRGNNELLDASVRGGLVSVSHTDFLLTLSRL